MALQPELIGLVLIAALCHATWNAFVKVGADRLWTLTFVLVPAGAVGVVVVPFLARPDPVAWWYLVAGMLIHTAYYLFLVTAYRLGDLSHVYPIARGSAPLLVALGAFLFAGEALSPTGIAGVGLASLGIMSLTLARGRAPGRAEMRPLLAALATGSLTATYTVVDGLGIRASGAPIAYILWLSVLKPLPLLLWWLTARRRRFVAITRGHWRHGVLAGVFAFFAYNLVLFALAYGAMAHVAALRETSMIFAAVIGAVVLKEGFGPRRIAAAAMVAAGVIVLNTAP